MPEHDAAPIESATNSDDTQQKPESSSFDEFASGQDPGIITEFIWFLRYNKKWWMAPILVILLLLVGLAFLTTSPAAPFIYTLF